LVSMNSKLLLAGAALISLSTCVYDVQFPPLVTSRSPIRTNSYWLIAR
jgi:hypothetical protein